MKNLTVTPRKYLQASFCLVAPLLFVGCNSSAPPNVSAAPNPQSSAGVAQIIATPAPLPKQAMVIPIINLPNPNGYDLLVKAARSLPRESDLTQQKARAPKNAAALKMARQALQLPIVAPPQRGIAGTRLYHAPLRNLARAFTEQARVQADAGDFNAAADSDLDAVELGTKIQNGGGEITMLVGVAIEQIGRRELWEWRENLNAAQAMQAARRLEKIEAERSNLASMENAEKWQALSSVRQLLGEKDWQNFLAGQKSGWDTMFKNPDDLARLRKVSASQIEANLIAKMDAAIARDLAPYAPNSSRLAKAADPMSEMLTGSAGGLRTRVIYDSNRVENRLLITAFALQAFVKTTGKYPPNLNALVLKYLKTAPLDPFAPNTPLIYQLSSRTYTLYSVGPDGKDNGGTPISRRGISPESTGDIAVGFGDLR